MMTETFEHAGCTVKIGVEEEDLSFADPRDADNPSLLFCWHPSYRLGDEQFSRDDFHSMREAEAYLREERGAVGPILPLYLYDHSGISMSAGEPSPFDNPRVSEDEYGRGLGWDSSMVGFACAPEERIAACCGEGAEYRTDEWVEKTLRQEVRAYDAYLRGQVYYYVVENEDGEVVDSCGGFLVVDEDDYEGYLKGEARAAAEAEAHERAVNAEPDLEGAIHAAGGRP